MTFLFSRAEFTNYLVLFNSAAAGVVTDGAVAGYPNPLIAVVGAAPAAGVGVPLTINIDVVAGQVLLLRDLHHRHGQPTPGGDPNSGLLRAEYPGNSTQARRHNLDGNPPLSSPTRPRGILRPVFLVARSRFPSCFRGCRGTTVVGFEDIAGK